MKIDKMLNWLRKGDAQKKPPQPEVAGQVKAWMKEGFEYFRAGKHQAAQACFQNILREQPDHPDALYLSAVIASAEGRSAPALDLVSRAIASDAKVAAYHITRAEVLGALGREADAIASYRQAVILDPHDPQSRTGLGLGLLDGGRYDEALEHLNQAAHLAPAVALTHYNLGVALQALKRDEEAVQSYRQALQLDPGHVQAGNNLGSLLHAQGAVEESIACFRRTLKQSPDYAPAWSNLGVALQSSRRVDEAEGSFLRAISLNPQDFGAHSNLAFLYREQGKIELSAAHSGRALAIRDSVGERVRLATLLPVVARSASEIQSSRRRFGAAIDEVRAHGGVLDDPLRTVGACNFNLAYQPECDRELQEKAAQLYLEMCPSLHYTAPHCRRPCGAKGARIKVGFISKFMHEHSIGRTTSGLLANVSRERFHVTALFVPPLVDDSISKSIRDSADRYVVLPATLEAAREKIADLELDILFYQDIGMDAYTYFLAFSRLAPVQCVSFGHPDTTGIPNMDYWVSSENFEPEGASSHYSEALFLLRNLGTLAYYYRPALKQPGKTRSDFNLPQDSHLYLCPQSLFKVHPDFDPILAEILRGDPLGRVVLIEARASAWGLALRERFQAAMPDVVDRICFVPGMNTEDFLALIAVGDVMLDTLYFNGMNTSLEAFAVGTPVVTMPTGLQRGRHTYGMYKRMGIDECIAGTAQEYVSIALRLGTDKSFRDAMKARILSGSAVLYEDMEVVREFERFFVEAHERAISAPSPHVQSLPGSSGSGSDALFLVSSAIHVVHGIYNAKQRLEQTIDTCESIRKRCPHATIVILDGGVQALSAAEQDALSEYASSCFSFSEYEEVKNFQKISNQDIVKNCIEIFMFKTFFDTVSGGTFDLSRFKRVFKVSGRYCLNNNFNYEFHQNAANKIVISGPYSSQFAPEITGGIVNQYMSRLWSFDARLSSKISKCYNDMLRHVAERMNSGGYVDIEHLLYHHLDPEDILHAKKIGIQGAIAPTGKAVSD